MSSVTTLSPVLRADGVSVSFDGRPVLTDVSLAVDPGHRAGLVGENGVGKSTLLRVLAGTLEPDAGTVERPPDLGLLDQELPYPASTPARSVVEDALRHVRLLEADLERAAAALADRPEEASVARAYDRALAAAQQAEVWDADVRAARTLAGLRLDALADDQRVGEMSGGQRTRLGLAALLLRRPRALLLDEPTNHLDDDAADFLAGELATLTGAVLLASHDRTFLEQVATEIVDLDPGSSPEPPPVVYGGRYSDYLQQRRVALARWQERYEREQEELTQLRRAVAVTAREVAPGRGPRDNDKFLFNFKGARVDQTVSRRVRNAEVRLEQLEREQVRKPRPPLRFEPPSGPVPDGGLLAWAHHVRLAGRLDMDAAGLPSFEVPAGGRLLLTGPNGSGKSTLLHLLAGDLQPDGGSVGAARGVRIGLLEQDLPLEDEASTPRQLLAAAEGRELQPGERAAVEGHGLVAPRDLDRPVADLSVGTRRRVVLAMLVTQRPDVLLLDEPTNHISLALADELVAGLRDWPGAVVVASHDRWLRRQWEGDVAELSLGRR
ncbi:MAG TPA: ABC-F family ATP-binding cassette domain-containing protein [Actinotalea caeni]|uniref:ABC-F family ATP-binding cassette domain-containing protein n=1 Tax=Actinotalea caeni TaxID=1348467 RepID=UPI002B4AFCC8|nr:ABC-F family ATP-binding cassette domain-containing protein [Actinotalea caeni]HLV54105.1 ABC-F family ATP-binding cassette domain-containing protein [Actinotalea caeni]